MALCALVVFPARVPGIILSERVQAGVAPSGCLLWCITVLCLAFCVLQSVLSVVVWCVLPAHALAVCTLCVWCHVRVLYLWGVCQLLFLLRV